MSDLDDAVGDMVTDLLTEAGRSVTYYRSGVSQGTVTMSRQRQPSQYLDNGQGGIVEVVPIDFVCLTADLPVTPQRGDQITVGSDRYEVMPTIGEKVFRRLSDQMTRIHTKQVA